MIKNLFFADLRGFTHGNKILSVNVHNKLRQNENTLVSAFSMEVILALIHSGGVDTTSSEIRTNLLLPATKEETEMALSNVIPTIQGNLQILYLSNKIYTEEDFPIKEDFIEIATNIYGVTFHVSDLSNNGAKVKHWLAESEKDNHTVVSINDVTQATNIILVNTLSFHGRWTVPFQAHNTKKQLFYTAADSTIDVDMMHHEAQEFLFSESSTMNAKMLKMVLAGHQDIFMVVILPNEIEGLAQFEEDFDPFSNRKYDKQLVQVALPKFKIAGNIDFVRVLKELGVEKVFDATDADLSQLAGEKGDFYIGEIQQTLVFSVNEDGVNIETPAEQDEKSASDKKTGLNKTFIADHPFLFYVKVKNVVVFEGRVFTPRF